MVILQRLALTWLLLLGLAAPAAADPPIPALTGRVVDLAHILDSRTVDALTKQLADHEASATNQVVVVTLPSLQNYTIEQWGRALLNGWGIGQRDKNNGVVLVVAPNDRRLRIEVGYGLEYKLTDKAAADIIDHEIIPRFKGGDLTGGVTAGINAILQTIDGTYKPPLVEAPSGKRGISSGNLFRWAPFVVFPLFFIIIVVVNIVRGDTRNRRRYYDNDDGTTVYRRNRDDWGPRSSGFSGSRSSGGGFSGGGGRGGGGGASGRW